MFCNKCGKTLTPEAKACPSCGQPVGDSRFEGSGYTSSQVRFVPESTEQSGYAPYTKTTYSSSPDEGGDVYSRTSYRPALSEDESRETTGFREPEPKPEPEPEDAPQPEEEAPKEEDAPAPRREAREDSLSEEDHDALGIEIKPLEPIRKTGISPEVQRYIQQMNQKKTRMQRKAQTGQDAPESPDDESHAEASEEGEPHGSDAAQEGERAPRFGSGARKWAVRIGGIVAVVALLIVGILYIADKTANRAKVPGVTYSVYTEGLALIKSHTTSEYRTGIIKMWRADATGGAVTQQQETESQQISALLPEKPLDNDPLFIDTLLSIQKSIEEATATDALAALSAGQTTLGTLSAESEQGWELINNAIARLDIATETTDLEAIIKGVDLSNIATPEPEASATPAPYKTLKKGMKNNKQVKNLQERLYKLGWFNGVRDGDFGPATQSAVKKFQKAIGLPVEQQDGIATSDVQVRLFAADAPRGDGKNSAPAATAAAETAAADDGGTTGT